MICQINGALTFFVYYFNRFFLRLIITCRLWVIYVREDNYSNVWVMIKRLIWTIWTPMSSVLKKADKLNLSLSLHPMYVVKTLQLVRKSGTDRFSNEMHRIGLKIGHRDSSPGNSHQGDTSYYVRTSFWHPVHNCCHICCLFGAFVSLHTYLCVDNWII